jgi:hypothetical protein
VAFRKATSPLRKLSGHGRSAQVRVAIVSTALVSKYGLRPF